MLGCFVDWLEKDPSDQKNHRILLALGRESLKKARSAHKNRKFDKKEIAEAAGINPDEVDMQSWFRWTDIEKYWNARRDNFIAFARLRRLDHCPTLERNATTGGRNTPAEHWLDIETLPVHEHLNRPVESMSDSGQSEWPKQGDAKTIHYEVTQPGEVTCFWWLRPWLKTGSFSLNGWRRWSVIGLLLSLGLPTLLAGVYGYALLVAPVLINRQNVAMFILCLAWAYVMWRVFVRPVVHLLDDRIIHTDMIAAFNEDPAQVEVMKEGERGVVRLVRYTSACGICGATVSLGKGEPDYPRRIVGRCSESPREHVFSFDRVTRKGKLLRCFP